MKVRFAVICDHCGLRGDEYVSAYYCTECHAEICRDCSVRHDSETGRAMCKMCDEMNPAGAR